MKWILGYAACFTLTVIWILAAGKLNRAYDKETKNHD
jgi:hypothetical protein